MDAIAADHASPSKDEFSPVEGESYLSVLARLHAHLKPTTYLEIGTSAGGTLKLAGCKSLAVDPAFRIGTDVIGKKPACLLFQSTSDRFFHDHDPGKLLGAAVDLAFLDGLHLFEQLLRDLANTERYCRRDSVIALHDCVPADRWMAERIYTEEGKKASQRPGWWTGDVWKCLPALKKYRADLRICVLDAAPTGLVLITNLDPKNSVLHENYWQIVDEFIDLDIAQYGIGRYQRECAMISTKDLSHPYQLSKFLRL